MSANQLMFVHVCQNPWKRQPVDVNEITQMLCIDCFSHRVTAAATALDNEPCVRGSNSSTTNETCMLLSQNYGKVLQVSAPVMAHSMLMDVSVAVTDRWQGGACQSPIVRQHWVAKRVVPIRQQQR